MDARERIDDGELDARIQAGRDTLSAMASGELPRDDRAAATSYREARAAELLKHARESAQAQKRMPGGNQPGRSR